MFISAINNAPKASFGHIYSNAVDTVLKSGNPLTRKQESKLYDTVSRASRLYKSVITSSSTKGFVLLTKGKNGEREIYRTYQTYNDVKNDIDSLEETVQDAERLELTSLPKINPLKKGISKEAAMGIPEIYGYNYGYIYDKTYNGYNASF